MGWTGPDYDRDYISIGKVGEDGYENYAFTDSGNPVTVALPETPGEYELRYFIGQDRAVIGTRPITVTK